jgi:hypothetical protein
MIEQKADLRIELLSAAEKAILAYANGILSEEWLVEQVALE